MQGDHLAIIGGTGFEKLPAEIFSEQLEVETACGIVRLNSISDNYTEPYRLYFLSRHGEDHGLAPHQINYRANILALKELGVNRVLASNAVGGLRTELVPGTLLVPHDFIDFTRRREPTYFSAETWSHVDFSEPYSSGLRQAIIRAGAALGESVVESGVYLCCDGPRFETPAEIRMFAAWGADVVGMTGLPEAIYAREAGMEYAALTVVTNPGAGLSAGPVDHLKVTARMAERLPIVREILLRAAALLVESS